MTTTFIDTKAEATKAKEIAAKYGWEKNIEYFQKKYVSNLFVGFQNDRETKEMMKEISQAISFERSQKRAQRALDTTKKNEKSAAYLEKLERAAQIASTTGETVESVMSRIN